MSNKIRQSIDFKGISVFEKEIRISQFADDTNLFCADLSSVELKGLQIVADFGAISGLKLNIKKTKAIVSVYTNIQWAIGFKQLYSIW